VITASTDSFVGSELADSLLSDFLLDFFAARLRGDFGSIAMASNPLAHIF
jgi:hypothetical protein